MEANYGKIRRDRIFEQGGRWCQATQQAAKEVDVANVTCFDVYAPGPRFYHGIHGWELLAGIIGPGIAWIERVFEKDGYTQYCCEHVSGVVGHLHVGGPRQRVIQWQDDRGPHELELSIPDIHDGFCRTFVQMIRTGQMPAPIHSQLEPIRSALLAEQACELEGRQHIEHLLREHVVDPQAFLQTFQPRPLLPV